MNQTTTSQKMSPLRKIGYTSSVIGGGIVGKDYATWMQVDPMTGALIGSAISFVITKILYYLKDDPEKTVEGTLMGLGGLAGAIFGGYVGYQTGMSEDQESILAFLGGGSFLGMLGGAMIGKVITAFISFGALLLLFISRGPAGMYLRNLVSPEETESEIMKNGHELIQQMIDGFSSLIG